MNWKFHEHYLFVDLEATCANDHSIPKQQRETIEIGAVMVKRASRQTVGQFQEYIRPLRHAKLTEFCTKLTGITQDQVESADLFPGVFRRFSDWCHSYADVYFFSWGTFDRKQFHSDCKFHQLAYTLPPHHMDFKKLFYKTMILSKRAGLQETLSQLGLAFEGKPHSALSDAANTARLLPCVLEVNEHA